MDNDLIDISNYYEAQEESRIMMQEQAVLDELNRIMDEAA